MAATILAKDLLWRVSDKLGDVNPQFIRWTERELVNALNDGQRLIASLIPACCSRTDVIKLAPGSRQSIDHVLAANIKPGDASTPADTYGRMLIDFVRNMGSDGLSPGSAPRITSRETLDAYAPDWHTVTDEAVEEYFFDARQPKVFYVTPAPGTTAVWAEIAWLVNPRDIPYSPGSLLVEGGSTVAISIDDMYADLLVHYILAQAYLKPVRAGLDVQVNAQLANTHVNLFNAAATAIARANAGQNPNLQLLPLTPGLAAAEK